MEAKYILFAPLVFVLHNAICYLDLFYSARCKWAAEKRGGRYKSRPKNLPVDEAIR
jgi:hypothetical protein